MRVYRVEHRTYGHGPYVVPLSAYECGAFCDDKCEHDQAYDEACRVSGRLCRDHSLNKDHPPPKMIARDYFCAFDSREALDTWFDGHADILHEAGFIVRVYKADKVVPDTLGQVVFRKTSAKALTTERL